MTDSMTSDRTAPAADAPATSGGVGSAWYLYGITTSGSLEGLAAVDPDAGPLEVLACGGLTAIVRRVPAGDFSSAALQERLRSPAGLEEMVRRHNHVIEAVHGQRAILPAKFGSVYAHREDVAAALEARHDVLLHQLRRLEACDEWAVHLYADRAAVAERISAHDPAIARLHEDRAASRPGRAYFLDRQIQAKVAVATDAAMISLAQHVFDRLARCAVMAEASPLGERDETGGRVEILRGSFLVRRDRLTEFEDEVRACADAGAGLSCEYSGPWPPYSFAAGGDGSSA